MSTDFTLYKAAIAADDAWSSLLREKFGKRAGDMRYRSEGKTTPELAAAYALFRQTSDAWQTEMDRVLSGARIERAEARS